MKCACKQIRDNAKQVVFRTLNEQGTEILGVWTACRLVLAFPWLGEERACAVSDLSGQIPLPGLWVYFCSAVSSYSGIVCNLHLRKYKNSG